MFLITYRFPHLQVFLIFFTFFTTLLLPLFLRELLLFPLWSTLHSSQRSQWSPYQQALRHLL
ncbi:hypothetical protein C1A50_0999 [Paenibacillus polymyxa]|nr:hypothetical protein C1A50_0999 [Paenibacillus polymyxa]